MDVWAKFGIPDIQLEVRPDGSSLLTTRQSLGPVARCVGDILQMHARERADQVFLACRENDGHWRKVSYSEALRFARAIGQALLDRKLGGERPILILAENGVDFGLLGLGASFVGIPFAPVSAAYARPGQGFGRLAYLIELVRPGLIFVDTMERLGVARQALRAAGCEIVVGDAGEASEELTQFSSLLNNLPTAVVDSAADSVGPDTVLKILFTSGSTDVPKGVINTHKMICTNQGQIVSTWPFLTERAPVLLDWLPWSHTFGGNFDFYMTLWNGGSYFIDEGKPAPGLIDRTIANLRDVSPTMLLNVPAGYALLMDRLELEPELAARIFSSLELMMYAAAAMPEPLQARIRELAVRSAGREVPLVSAWGATETAPLATNINFPSKHLGNIGLPVPGCEIKLAPVGDKVEIRVRGPNVSPGYWRRPDATASAFDEEGFYRSGDAVKLADPSAPSQGLLFDGRIVENFKLTTGTWVHVGQVRLALIAACAPLVQDAVITGHDRGEIGALIVPSFAGCRSMCHDLPQSASLSEMIAHRAVRDHIAAGLRKLARENPSSSMRITKALLLHEPLSIEKGEITDKGYINQRGVLKSRADLVEQLYKEPAQADVIAIAALA